MAKTVRRKRVINKSSVPQKPTAQIIPSQNIPQVIKNKPQTLIKTYDSSKYLANDLKWSFITAGIIAVILVIVYIFLR